MKRKYQLRAQGVDIETVATRVSELTGVDKTQIFLPGKERNRVKARSLYCYWAVRELGMSMSEISRKLELSLSCVSQSVVRGEIIAEEKGFCLINI